MVPPCAVCVGITTPSGVMNENSRWLSTWRGACQYPLQKSIEEKAFTPRASKSSGSMFSKGQNICNAAIFNGRLFTVIRYISGDLFGTMRGADTNSGAVTFLTKPSLRSWRTYLTMNYFFSGGYRRCFERIGAKSGGWNGEVRCRRVLLSQESTWLSHHMKIVLFATLGVQYYSYHFCRLGHLFVENMFLFLFIFWSYIKPQIFFVKVGIIISSICMINALQYTSNFFMWCSVGCNKYENLTKPEFLATAAAIMSRVFRPSASSTGLPRSGSPTVLSVTSHLKTRKVSYVPCRIWSSVSTTTSGVNLMVEGISSERFATILKFLGWNNFQQCSTPALFKPSRVCLSIMLSSEQESAQIVTRWI